MKLAPIGIAFCPCFPFILSSCVVIGLLLRGDLISGLKDTGSCRDGEVRLMVLFYSLGFGLNFQLK